MNVPKQLQSQSPIGLSTFMNQIDSGAANTNNQRSREIDFLGAARSRWKDELTETPNFKMVSPTATPSRVSTQGSREKPLCRDPFSSTTKGLPLAKLRHEGESNERRAVDAEDALFKSRNGSDLDVDRRAPTFRPRGDQDASRFRGVHGVRGGSCGS